MICIIFAYMNNMTDKSVKWSENVIVADANHIDRVAFNLIVNFERMIGRRIPKADMARWIDCIALDGGLREGENDVQVVLIHDKNRSVLENFAPGNLTDELNGKAFKDNLGEFTISACPVEDIVSRDDFFVDVVEAACAGKETKRIMVVPDEDRPGLYDCLCHAMRHVDDEKRVTMFAMQPMAGGNFRQEILGYSLMSALGISSDELK